MAEFVRLTRYQSKDTKLASVEEDVTSSREHKTEHKKGVREGDEGRGIDGIRVGEGKKERGIDGMEGGGWDGRGWEGRREEGREEHKGTTQ